MQGLEIRIEDLFKPMNMKKIADDIVKSAEILKFTFGIGFVKKHDFIVTRKGNKVYARFLYGSNKRPVDSEWVKEYQEDANTHYELIEEHFEHLKESGHKIEPSWRPKDQKSGMTYEEAVRKRKLDHLDVLVSGTGIKDFAIAKESTFIGDVGKGNKREILHLDIGCDEDDPQIELDECPQMDLPEIGGIVTVDYSFSAVYKIRDSDSETGKKPFSLDRFFVDRKDGKALVRPYNLLEMQCFSAFYYGEERERSITYWPFTYPRKITAKIYVGKDIYYKGPIKCHNTTFPLFIRKDPENGERINEDIPADGGTIKVTA
jgi:hypothetical protein